MIILDTCILLFDSLSPERLSKVATEVLESGEKTGQLYCSDISLWEIAMLKQKQRIIIATDYLSFMQSILRSRNIQVLSITPEIAALSVSLQLIQADPADRLIAATTVAHHAQLLTADQKLLDSQVPTLW
ncbi:MAG: type II toxin-antitoxin system VapC family toxin [Thiotrichaceae bacterium]